MSPVFDMINKYPAIALLVLAIVVPVWIATHRAINNRVKKATAPKLIIAKLNRVNPVTYSINIYKMRDGNFTWHIGHIELDSIFKVAQYAPPYFDTWTDLGWQIVDKASIYREYWREYYGDDGNFYGVLVGTDTGYWSQQAEAYLGHL